MGLYNKSAMAAILDMQISWFSNPTRAIYQRAFRFFFEDRMHIGDWGALTSICKEEFEYAN